MNLSIEPPSDAFSLPGLRVEITHLKPEKTVAEAEEMRRRIAEHPARLAVETWAPVKRCYAAVMANGNAVCAFLRGVEAGPWKQPDEEFYVELFMGFANYLSTAGALVDLSRILVKGLDKKTLLPEYERRKDRLAAMEEVVLVKALRNYLVHVSAPAVSIYNRADTDGQQITVLLTGDQLLEWDKCPALVKKVLEPGTHISILALLENHRTLLRGFYEQWLWREFDIFHGSQIREHDKLVLELASWYEVVADGGVVGQEGGPLSFAWHSPTG